MTALGFLMTGDADADVDAKYVSVQNKLDRYLKWFHSANIFCGLLM